jgi:ankyrin repeat protein
MLRLANKGNALGVRSLLKHGADPLLRDEKGRLALHYVSLIFAIA